MITGFQAFVRAVGWGTLAGAAPYLGLLILPMSLVMLMAGYGSIGEFAILLAYPLMLSGAMVLGSAVIFGLPLTAVLSRSEREDGGTYGVAGFVLGALVPAAIVGWLAGELNEESLFFALPGAFAGIVTGISWGRWREAQRAAREA